MPSLLRPREVRTSFTLSEIDRNCRNYCGKYAQCTMCDVTNIRRFGDSMVRCWSLNMSIIFSCLNFIARSPSMRYYTLRTQALIAETRTLLVLIYSHPHTSGTQFKFTITEKQINDGITECWPKNIW